MYPDDTEVYVVKDDGSSENFSPELYEEVYMYLGPSNHRARPEIYFR